MSSDLRIAAFATEAEAIFRLGLATRTPAGEGWGRYRSHQAAVLRRSWRWHCLSSGHLSHSRRWLLRLCLQLLLHLVSLWLQ
jgi:hypothetical protein